MTLDLLKEQLTFLSSTIANFNSIKLCKNQDACQNCARRLTPNLRCRWINIVILTKVKASSSANYWWNIKICKHLICHFWQTLILKINTNWISLFEYIYLNKLMWSRRIHSHTIVLTENILKWWKSIKSAETKFRASLFIAHICLKSWKKD